MVVLLYLERAVVVLLAAIALLLALLSFRGLVPLADPITPLGYIDRLSLLFGLHETANVIVVDTHQWSTDVHLYTFQRRLKDSAFYLAGERTEVINNAGGGLLEGRVSPVAVERRCGDILAAADRVIPFTLTAAARHNIPILMGLPPLENVETEEARRLLVSGLDACLANAPYSYSREGSIGIITPQRQLVMQWFALSLLNGRLPYLKPAETPVLAETNENNLELTFAVSSLSRVKNETIKMLQKVSVFGETWDLVTVRVPQLGVYQARQMVLTGGQLAKELAVSPCVNPVVDRWWEYGGKKYHVKGLLRSVEEVKERNGPFAGKKVSRPVANYDGCHAVVLDFVNKALGQDFAQVIQDLRRRKVYIRGQLFIQCAERGLTDPFKGGDVQLKSFMESLKHACKVPNTDQPYACADMMVTGVILDKVLGLHKGSVLYTTQKVGEFTGDWPVAAALQIYQDGL